MGTLGATRQAATGELGRLTHRARKRSHQRRAVGHRNLDAAGLAQLPLEPADLGGLLLEQGLGALAQAPLLFAGGRADQQFVVFAF